MPLPASVSTYNEMHRHAPGTKQRIDMRMRQVTVGPSGFEGYLP